MTEVTEVTLKEARINAHLTQAQAAEKLGVSLRSYKSYENDPQKQDTIKYRYMLEQMEEVRRIDEDHGLLNLDEIRGICAAVFADYPVSYCYLFGSYAKGNATGSSDVDLLVSGEVEGLRFYGLVEALRTAMRKRIDVLTPGQLLNNPAMLDEILRDGIRIYEQRER